MRAFQLVSARDSRHAIELLAQHAPEARILAGGTDLLVDLKSSPRAPQFVIDISRAADMRGIVLTDRGLRIGALATHAEIERSALVREKIPALAEAVHSIGAVQTRNLGSLGGNLVTCVPSMDGGPVLLALDARVTLAGPRGTRDMPLAKFFVAPRRTALAPDEMLLEIIIPNASLGKPAAFVKFGLRKGQALALVNVAASVRVDSARRVFASTALALGAVAPTVMRASRAEAYLDGKEITTGAMTEAGRIAASEAAPISDFRASAEYRRELIAVLTRRALERALARART